MIWFSRKTEASSDEAVVLTDNGSLRLNLNNPSVIDRLRRSINGDLAEELRKAQKARKMQPHTAG